MRLIDADALADEMAVFLERNNSGIGEWYANYIEDMIAEAPTIDAVEVVRCKDCKWRGKLGCAITIVDESDKPKDDDFCSWGERREER